MGKLGNTVVQDDHVASIDAINWTGIELKPTCTRPCARRWGIWSQRWHDAQLNSWNRSATHGSCAAVSDRPARFYSGSPGVHSSARPLGIAGV